MAAPISTPCAPQQETMSVASPPTQISSSGERYCKEFDVVNFFAHLRSIEDKGHYPISQEQHDLLKKRRFLPQDGLRRTITLLSCGACIGGALYGAAATTTFVEHTAINFMGSGSLSCGAESFSHLLNKIDSDNSNITQDATYKIRKLYSQNSGTLLTVSVVGRRTFKNKELDRFNTSLARLSKDVQENYEKIQKLFEQLFSNHGADTFIKPLKDTLSFLSSNDISYLQYDQNLLITYRTAMLMEKKDLTASESSLLNYLMQ